MLFASSIMLVVHFIYIIWISFLLQAILILPVMMAECPEKSPKGKIAVYSNCFKAGTEVQDDTSITEVCFKYNVIQKIEKDFLLPIPNVNKVEFINNSIESLDENVLKQVKYLQDLYIEEKKLNLSETHVAVFQNLNKLKALSIDIESMQLLLFNHISNESLETLTICNTRIWDNTGLAKTIELSRPFRKLKNLTFKNCALTELRIITNLSSLVFLELSHNLISDLSKINLPIMLNLKTFIMTDNKIKTIAKNTFDNNKSLLEVDLRGNEFKTMKMTQNGNSAITFRIKIHRNQVNAKLFKIVPDITSQYEIIEESSLIAPVNLKGKISNILTKVLTSVCSFIFGILLLIVSALISYQYYPVSCTKWKCKL